MFLYRWLSTAYSNIVNTVVYILTFGTVTRHEGRLRFGVWRNWNTTVRVRPRVFAYPTSEAEICKTIREARKVRVVGGGHSFNESPLCSDTMISLDKYNRVLSVDNETHRVTVQAGIRLRDLQAALKKLRLALPAAGSTDAQSLGGLCATDVHGTGKEHAFLSEQITALRIINAAGEPVTVGPDSDLYHAALGGLGCVGVVTELTIQCVPLYNLQKRIEIVSKQWCEQNIEKIIHENDHVSFYYLGGVHSKRCRLNVWNNTTRRTSFFAQARKMGIELIDMVFSACILGAARWLHKLDAVAELGFRSMQLLMHNHTLVQPATAGFARKLFYRHDEIEYGVPFERYQECLNEIQTMLLEKNFFCVIELRFSPNRSAGLLTPGAGRRTCYIELAPSLSIDQTAVFTLAEAIFKKYDGHVHLGKRTRATASDLQRMYGARYDRFQHVRSAQDPTNKFLNDFSARLFQTS